MKTITIQIPEELKLTEKDVDRLVKKLLKRIILVDLSLRLRLTEKEAEEIDRKVKEGALRRLR